MAQRQVQWWVAQDNFSAELPPDGTPVTVHRGQTYPDGHPVVKLDGGRGVLFKPQDQVPEPPDPGKAPAKPAGKAP